ncbi:MAG: sialidase family protein, partial [Ignavibacteria bacterium]|nr:sialidase family protein [Ignavibacteria bacterium]
MKYLLIFILSCFSAVILAQTPNWTNVKETNINVSSALSVDIFTNKDDNHIIVQESNALKYYKMNVNGVAGSPVTLESSSVVSPSISGDATRIYVVYRKSNETSIRTKYSTNGGSTWSYLSQNPPNSNASSIESVMSNGKLHVTYQVGNQVKYSSNSLTGGNWTADFTVSSTENGTSPRITARYDGQNDYVYFLYKKQNVDEGKWRRYNVGNNSWGTLYTGFALSDVLFSYPTGIRVTGDRIFLYYDYYKVVFGNPIWHFAWRELSFSNSLLGGNYIFGNQS